MNLFYSKSGVIVDKSTAASCLAPGPPVGEGLEGRAGEEGLQVLPPALVLPGLRYDRYIREYLRQPFPEISGLVVKTPGVCDHDQGQGGGQHHPAGLVHLQDQGLACRGLDRGRNQDCWLTFDIGLVICATVSINTATMVCLNI